MLFNHNKNVRTKNKTLGWCWKYYLTVQENFVYILSLVFFKSLKVSVKYQSFLLEHDKKDQLFLVINNMKYLDEIMSWKIFIVQ